MSHPREVHEILVGAMSVRRRIENITSGAIAPEHRGQIIDALVQLYDTAPLKQVLDAWTVPGPHPEIHRKEVGKLRSHWPTLAGALDRLARNQGKRVP